MTEALIIKWHKEPGEALREGDPLVEIETDKVQTDVEAPVSGTLTEILVGVGDDVPVGATLAIIEPA